MIELHLVDPVGHLASRLLVPDAAGLVAERLQLQGIANLGAAFRELGPGGRRLLERLPELDAWLEAVSEVPVGPAPDMSSAPEAEEIERALDELLGEDPAPQAPRPRMSRPVVDPEAAGGVLGFAAGLVLGIALLDERTTDPLGQPRVELEEAIAILEGRSLDLARLTGSGPAEVALGLSTVVERLIALDSGFGLQLRALRNLAVGRPGPVRAAGVRRLLFLAGLVGAGVVLRPRKERGRTPAVQLA